MARLRYGLPLLLGVLAGACGDEEIPTEPPPPPPEPAFHGADVRSNPVNTISAQVVVTASLYDSARVRYWHDGAAPLETPAFAFREDTVLAVPVLGLDTFVVYAFEIELYVGDSIAVAVDTAAFETGRLPSWIHPAVAQGSDTTPGFLALSYPEGPVIVDNAGTVRWYLHAPDDILITFQAHDNGRYTLFRLTDTIPRFRVLDQLGTEVGSLGCSGFPTRFHDLLWNAAGDYWVFCNDSTVMDLTAVGGQDSVNTIWTVLQHIGADGQVLFEWRTQDHFDVTDLELGQRLGTRANITHGNSVILDVDGNLLLSFRSLNEITKVNAVTGEVMWRFGGERNQFTFVNDAKAEFFRPHGLQLAGPGQIQFLDNGRSAPSRFVRYLINPQTMTATLVVEFIDAPSTFTPVGGGTQFYGNGYSAVTFGRAGRVVEVDPAGNRAWELVGINNVYVFRVQRITSLYELSRTLPFTFP